MIQIPVYVESVEKRAFAGVIEWPGWHRGGRSEAEALAALLDYGPRYGAVMLAGDIEFAAPGAVEEFAVIERLPGNSGTEFGAPGLSASVDAAPLDSTELAHLLAILNACRAAFLRAVEAAEGYALRSGPRGGGRDLARIAEHVFESERAYLSRLGGKHQPEPNADRAARFAGLFAAQDVTLAASARGEIPPYGPRGGARWTAREFIRHGAWHLLDHAWEIEDRVEY